METTLNKVIALDFTSPNYYECLMEEDDNDKTHNVECFNIESAYYTIDLEEYIELQREFPEDSWYDDNYNSPIEIETLSDHEIGMVMNTPTCYTCNNNHDPPSCNHDNDDESETSTSESSDQSERSMESDTEGEIVYWLNRERYMREVLQSVRDVIHHLENDVIKDVTVTSTFMELLEKWFESDTKIKQLNKKLFGSIESISQFTQQQKENPSRTLLLINELNEILLECIAKIGELTKQELEGNNNEKIVRNHELIQRHANNCVKLFQRLASLVNECHNEPSNEYELVFALAETAQLDDKTLKANKIN